MKSRVCRWWNAIRCAAAEQSDVHHRARVPVICIAEKNGSSRNQRSEITKRNHGQQCLILVYDHQRSEGAEVSADVHRSAACPQAQAPSSCSTQVSPRYWVTSPKLQMGRTVEVRWGGERGCESKRQPACDMREAERQV